MATAFNFNNFNNPGRRLGGDNPPRRADGRRRHQEARESPPHHFHHATDASRHHESGHGRYGGPDEHEARQIQRDHELARRLTFERSDDEPGPSSARAGRGGRHTADRAEAGPSRVVHERERTPYASGPRVEPGPSNAPHGQSGRSAAPVVEAGPSNTHGEQPERNAASMTDHTSAPATNTATGTPSAQDTDGTTCIACADVTTPNHSIATGCKHRMCRECLEGAVRAGLNDRQFYPPRCCPIHEKGEITLVSARKFLPAELIREYESKAEEWGAKNGTYCYVPRCSAFIPPKNVREDRNMGTCPKCRAQTCTLCKLESHPGKKCPNDPGKQALKTLADDKGWKACPSCGVMVELVFGCNQMKCRCGNTFCYSCGGPYGQCRCKLWDESNRHLERPPGEYWEHQWEQVNWDDDFENPAHFFNPPNGFAYPGNIVNPPPFFPNFHHQHEHQPAPDPLAGFRGFGELDFEDFWPRGPRGFAFPEPPPRRHARRSRWDGFEDELMAPRPFRHERRPPRGPPPRRGYWDYY